MDELSWAETVRHVYERADNRCEYCQTDQRSIGQSMHVEHIDPEGGDHPNNLCLACPNCNLSKAQATSAVDPESNQTVVLFNPRRQAWVEHFEWIYEGTVLNGKTQTGRATTARLKINRPRMIQARSIWIRAGEHPPKPAGD